MMQNYKKRMFTSFFLFLLIYLIYNFNLILIYSLIVLGTLSILEFLQITGKIIKKKFYYLIINFLFIFYISIFCILFGIFNNFLQLKIILFSLLVGCAASDIGGYIFGKIFKGPKLTKISPNKTISGSFGALLFSILIIKISIFYFTGSFNLKLIPVAIVTSASCQLGDLFFSFLKRKAKIKDTGNFFPGHGGVLDRLDGILLGVPIGYLSLVIFI
tara:strand:+ start:266 stop:913 length:648 start_codon:yes stop_codon:yes gene_type:complete